MANNPYVNKVVFGGQTVIDLSTDTVTSSDDILAGKVGHLRDGSVVTGTASGGDQHGTIWQDGQGYVHLDDESGIALQSKTANPTESQQVIEADTGYYALDKVTVGAISATYVGSEIARKSSSDLTVSGATVTAPAGYYSSSASKAVATGTAGTPTATKGTVSNHAVTVTPSVTNTTGYISGGTKTGTSVSVSASELVSGTYSVNSSGTKDVTNYASISVPAGTEGTPTATKGSVSNHSVSVTPSVTNTGGYISGTTKTGTAVTVSASELVSGTKTITENGTGIDVTTYASVNVQIGQTYTATITSAGSSSSAYINYKNVKYYTVGTFTFTAEDNFSVVATGNVGGKITYNDDVYNVTSKSFTFPNSDITISMSTGSTGKVNIQTSMLPITANGKHTVNGYDRVNVSVTPTLLTKNITANGTYNASSDSADGYSSVTVNVSGGGGAKLGALRSDAELIKTWSGDYLAVSDLGANIPAYSTSSTSVLSTSQLPDSVTLDLSSYRYIICIRRVITPVYATVINTKGRCEYTFRAATFEVVYFPAGCFSENNHNDSYSIPLVNEYFGIVYQTAPSAAYLAANTQTSLSSIYGVHDGTPLIGNFMTLSWSNPTMTITALRPALYMRQSNTYFTQEHWENVSDIRMQYVTEIWRVPKGGVDGFNIQSQTNHILDCVMNERELT